MATPRHLLPLLLVLALLGGAVLAWRILGGIAAPPASTKREVAAAAAATERDTAVATPAAARAQDAELGGDLQIADDAPPTFPAMRRSGPFVAEIVDARGAPVAATEVRIDSWIGGHFADLAIADDRDLHRRLRADSDGRVAIAELAEGAYSIAARADDGRSAQTWFDFSLTHAEAPLRLKLSDEPTHPPGIEVTVVGTDGAPVAEAEVELFGTAFDRGRIGGPTHPPLKSRSDALGVARFDELRWHEGMAFARAPDGRVGAKKLGGERLAVEAGEADANGASNTSNASDASDAEPDFANLFGAASVPDSADSPFDFSEMLEGMSGANEPDGAITGRATGEKFVTAKLVVGPPGRIEGRIEFAPEVADPDAALAGATIEAWLATSQIPHQSSCGRSATVAVAGRSFAFDGLPAGTHSLVLHAPAGARLVLDRLRDGGALLENSVAPPVAEVKSGATTPVTLHATIGATIHGHVHRADGSPVAGARVVATFGPWRFEPGDAFVRHEMHVWSFGPESGLEGLHPLTHAVARTDAHGDYRLTGLQPGLHRIMVTAHAQSFDCREWTAVVDGGVLELDHELEPAGALQGIAPNGGFLGITRVGDARPVALATLLGDRVHSFTFGGLRPGIYILAEFAEERRTPPVERGRATVEAGRTTFVDLSDAPAPIEIAGVVVDARGAVASAVVDFDSIRRHVDGAGAFDFHCSFPDEEGYELIVETDQLTEGFLCPADASHGGGFSGTLRLGDETLRLEVHDPRRDAAAHTVELRRAADPSHGDPRESLHTKRLALDASGALTIDHLQAGRYELRVVAHGTTVLKTKVELPHTDVLRLEVADAGSLRVHVVDAAGKPAPQWSVVACTYLRDGEIPDDFTGHDEWFTTTNAPTGSDGVARLDHVPAGKIVVKAEAASDFLYEAFGVTQNAHADAPPPARLELRPGEQREVELRLPAPAQGGR